MTIKLERAEALVEQFSRQRILVVGDLMLDRYVYGTVERICPEAPVPVVDVTEERWMPGGASNVARNVRSLSGHAVACGIVGKDPEGERLQRLFELEGVGFEASLQSEEIRTTVKTRVIAARQQVVRVDWDNKSGFSEGLLNTFCEVARRGAGRATGVIIEDYGKGVVQQQVVDTVIEAARAAGVPTGFDPKDNRELDVAGVNVATPNRREAYHAVGVTEGRPAGDPTEDTELLRVGELLLVRWAPEHLLITLGPQGMLLFSSRGPVRHVPTRAREVFDVSGAGDTVIATYVLALAAGAAPEEAAELANHAAGVVVGKLGTATCDPVELLESIENDGS